MAITANEFPTTITLPDGDPHEITIDDGTIQQTEAIDVTVDIITAATTVNVSVGQTPTAETPALAAGKHIVTTVHRNGDKLWLEGVLNDVVNLY